MNTKDTIRQQIRTTRKSLTPTQHEDLSRIITQHALSTTYFHQGKNFGFYWPLGSEVDIRGFIEIALLKQKNCYLPKVPAQDKKLTFLPYKTSTSMQANQYGILEPAENPAEAIELNKLDCVFVPLIGFDKNGHRLGQGGGYYDATFKDNPKPGPSLIGIAYALQEVEELPLDHWDLKLDGVVTEHGLQTF